jgi:hypothetical protein
MGEKDALGWVPASHVLTPYSYTCGTSKRSWDILLAATERTTLLSTTGDQPPPTTSVYATVQAPAADGSERKFLYLTFRAMYNSFLDGVQLHEISVSTDEFLSGATLLTTTIGGMSLIDTAPSTMDQMDADIDPGSAFIHGQGRGGDDNPMLIEVPSSAYGYPSGSSTSQMLCYLCG